MARNTWIVALVLAIGVAAVGQVEPLGIVVEPPAGDLAVTITTDKPAYAVGETVRITFTINKAAYIYIWDIMPDGNVTQIFPNGYESQNYFPAGTHTIPTPGRGYSFRVQPPLGTEWLQIMATTYPVSGFTGYSPGDPFPLLGADPEDWQVQVLGLVPEPTGRAFDFTSFEIVASAPPGYGTLIVRSTPTGASLYVDGMFRGYTPRSVNLLPGFHNILVRKAGYQDYTARIYLVAGGTRTLEPVLSPTAPANQPPVAQFTFTPSNPAPGAVVTFNAGSSYDPDGTIANYQWDFNNNGVFERTGATTTWTFPIAGTYSVRLVVTDNRGATGQTIRQVTVIAVNQPPVAQFTYTPPAPRPGDWVQFDGGTSYDPDGSIVNYEWDFQNDGVFDATGQVVFHQYPVAGTYTVRLRVTDNLGATGQTTRTVTVAPVVVNQPPVAQFTYTPAAPTTGAAVTFNGTASYDPDGTVVAYAWDLTGNGVIDRSGPVVTWTYAVAGTYNATLYVTDNQGATGQTTQVVAVSPVGIPGMPGMALPGIYVWGTDTWRITVNGSGMWVTPRAYRIELRTDGQFINVSSDAGPYPLGLVPEPVSEGWRIVFEGTVSSGRITHSFQVRNASSIYMDLRLDMDGDGTLDRSAGFVRLRQFGVNPPVNPLVVGNPEGYTGELVPSLNFRIGSALSYTEFVRIVFWQTTIGALEGM
ncbi:PKD domain-containing protein [Candidatus Bipolaricaulota bacterium]|nr:PKD domain-containing protein [Candidatus Bipolaricaulota bacterium]